MVATFVWRGGANRMIYPPGPRRTLQVGGFRAHGLKRKKELKGWAGLSVDGIEDAVLKGRGYSVIRARDGAAERRQLGLSAKVPDVQEVGVGGGGNVAPGLAGCAIQGGTNLFF
jgi:hypothetical protein